VKEEGEFFFDLGTLLMFLLIFPLGTAPELGLQPGTQEW